MRRKCVLVAVPRHEGDVDALELADSHGCGWRAIGRCYGNFAYVIEKLVEAGASENAYHEPGVQIFGGGGSSFFSELSLANSICTWSRAFWIGCCASSGTSGSM
jgi:hypothetical protein